MRVPKVSPVPALMPGDFLQQAANQLAMELSSTAIVSKAMVMAHEQAYANLAEEYNKLVDMLNAMIPEEPPTVMPEAEGEQSE